MPLCRSPPRPALPLMLHAFAAWDYGGAMGWATVPQSLAALGVAHLLAERHTSEPGDPARSAGAAIAGRSHLPRCAASCRWRWYLAAAHPADPGPSRRLRGGTRRGSCAGDPARDNGRGADAGRGRHRPDPGDTMRVLLGAWLLAIVVWRRFTLPPCSAWRSAPSSSATWRWPPPRRSVPGWPPISTTTLSSSSPCSCGRLDEAGAGERRGQAREVATKLRSVVGDLRLPILDDLGAGAGARMARGAGGAARRRAGAAGALRRHAAAGQRRARRLPRGAGGADERHQAWPPAHRGPLRRPRRRPRHAGDRRRGSRHRTEGRSRGPRSGPLRPGKHAAARRADRGPARRAPLAGGGTRVALEWRPG